MSTACTRDAKGTPLFQRSCVPLCLLAFNKDMRLSHALTNCNCTVSILQKLHFQNNFWLEEVVQACKPKHISV